MSGYTQEDVKNLIIGSERANQMKREIEFILRFIIGCTRTEVEGIFLVSKGVPKNEVIFSVQMGEINGFIYALVFRKYKRDMSIELTCTGNEEGYDRVCQKHFYGLEYGVANLSLDFVKSVHDKLPLILEEASKRFPYLKEKIRLLTEFVNY